MAKFINKGWSKPGDEIPQPIGVVLGANLRRNSELQSPPKPKIQHGSSSGGRFPVLSPDEAAKLGIDTGPVLVISPVPRPRAPHWPTEETTDVRLITAEQAATLKQLAEAAYEREAFQPNLILVEDEQRWRATLPKLQAEES